MKEQHIPVGIYKNEIFIAEVKDGKFTKNYYGDPRFSGVLRPVSSDMLETLRNPDERRGEYKDLWKQAVQAGSTEDSFEDWLEEVWSEEMDEDDPESFPGKDDSDCEYLTEDFRKEADDFLLEHENIEVGTWESAGSYSPDTKRYDSETGRWASNFKKFDYVFSNPLSKALAKEYVASLKK
jgi:hypothetical protein